MKASLGVGVYYGCPLVSGTWAFSERTLFQANAKRWCHGGKLLSIQGHAQGEWGCCQPPPHYFLCKLWS